MINRRGRIHLQKKTSSSQENNSFDHRERMLDEIRLKSTKNQIARTNPANWRDEIRNLKSENRKEHPDYLEFDLNICPFWL
jgi:hypothetical protein